MPNGERIIAPICDWRHQVPLKRTLRFCNMLTADIQLSFCRLLHCSLSKIYHPNYSLFRDKEKFILHKLVVGKCLLNPEFHLCCNSDKSGIVAMCHLHQIVSFWNILSSARFPVRPEFARLDFAKNAILVCEWMNSVPLVL